MSRQYDIINMALAKGEAENYGSAPLGFYPKHGNNGERMYSISMYRIPSKHTQWDCNEKPRWVICTFLSHIYTLICNIPPVHWGSSTMLLQRWRLRHMCIILSFVYICWHLEICINIYINVYSFRNVILKEWGKYIQLIVSVFHQHPCSTPGQVLQSPWRWEPGARPYIWIWGWLTIRVWENGREEGHASTKPY